MARADLVVASRQVVTPQGLVPAAIVVRDGTITAVGDYGAAPDARVRLDAGDAVVLPGLVDTHVHVNEPGRTEWEGFESATRAAAAGVNRAAAKRATRSCPSGPQLKAGRHTQRAAITANWRIGSSVT